MVVTTRDEHDDQEDHDDKHDNDQDHQETAKRQPEDQQVTTATPRRPPGNHQETRTAPGEHQDTAQNAFARVLAGPRNIREHGGNAFPQGLAPPPSIGVFREYGT